MKLSINLDNMPGSGPAWVATGEKLPGCIASNCMNAAKEHVLFIPNSMIGKELLQISKRIHLQPAFNIKMPMFGMEAGGIDCLAKAFTLSQPRRDLKYSTANAV